ncbi:MAG: hypothetical protein HYS06_06620 [Methylocystis sp.]|nr:hypothetical protein [Methylocystis sp.]MBI3275037.1 hypothetical protein [Methylocystis sp.]
MTSPAITFDKLAYVDRLKESGVDEKQARAHAEALDLALRDTVATKADVADAKKELEAKIEVTAANLKADLLRWLFTSQVALAGVLLAALKFLR